MDLSKLSDSDLMALQANDLSKISNEGLNHLQRSMSNYTGDIPTPMSATYQQPKPKSFLDKTAQALSGGKYGSMQDLAYGGETPADSLLGKAGQLLHQSGIEGLAGVGPVGQVSSTMTAIGQNIPNVAKYTAPIGEALSKIPSTILGKTSGIIDPKAINVAYQVGKSGNPELQAAMAAGKEIPIMPESRMIYNYARQLGLPHDIAATAEHYNNTEKGAWGLWNAAKAQGVKFPAFEDFSKLDLPEQIKLAQQAGVDLGTYLPQNKMANALAKGTSGAAGLGALGHLPAVLQGLVSAKLLPALAVQSPRIVGNMAQGAGKIVNAAEQISPYISSAAKALPTNQTAALLARLLSNQGEQ